MFKKLVLTALTIVFGFLFYVASRPSHFEVARELEVQAPAEKIFPFINNSKLANDWMPWKDSDPEVRMSYSGPDEGVGSTSSWESSGHMGTGKAEVVVSEKNKSVKTQLTYTKPMAMTQLAEVSLTPTATGTRVRWQVSGESNFMGRLMCVFMNMDKMVGGEFEKGLSRLKTMVEKPL